MGLKQYKLKRDFENTPEPSGLTLKDIKSKRREFVVQKHDASHLHFDFRLELEKVLKSWAIPKEPSTNPSIKRLAIQVEDHPFEYRKFEGVIPAGNYGAGTVEIWDKGYYYPLNSKKDFADEKSLLKDLKKGKILFALEGEKLFGVFCLVKLKNTEKDNQWLFFKIKEND